MLFSSVKSVCLAMTSFIQLGLACPDLPLAYATGLYSNSLVDAARNTNDEDRPPPEIEWDQPLRSALIQLGIAYRSTFICPPRPSVFPFLLTTRIVPSPVHRILLMNIFHFLSWVYGVISVHLFFTLISIITYEMILLIAYLGLLL
jgi:hypothetical protein